MGARSSPPRAAAWLRSRALGAVLALGLVAVGAPARAEPLGEEESARLAAGEVVARNVDASVHGGQYVGGIAYAIIDAPPVAVLSALIDPEAYLHILPLAQEAREVGQLEGDRLFYFRHGSSLGSGGYTCRVRAERGGTVRFWMDPSQPHDFDDAWGYFRVDEAGPGRTLLTVGMLVDLGFGFARLLFEERIRARLLTTPGLVKTYVEGKRRARSEPAGRVVSSPP